MKPDRCKWAGPRLPLLVGGELTGLDRRRVERHVLVCRACREQKAAVARALGVLHLAAEQQAAIRGESLWPSVSRQVQESRRAAGGDWPNSRRVIAWRLGIAAAVLLLAASTGFGLWVLHSRYQFLLRPRPQHVVVQRSVAPPSDAIVVTSSVRNVVPASQARQVERDTLAEDLDRGGGNDGRSALVPTN